MTDHFQLTTIIATAIRECRGPAPGEQPDAHIQITEEDHRVAKAVLGALTDAGFEVCPKNST